MYHPEYGKAVKLAIELHKKYRSKINPAVRDLKLAIYYIQGGAITQASLALSAWAQGDLARPMVSKRYIDECRELVTGLIIVPEKSRQRYLKHFFEDEILTIEPEKQS